MRLLTPVGLLLLASGSMAEGENELVLSKMANISSTIDTLSTTGTEAVLRHNSEIASRLALTPVQGVKKMSVDEGEKFFLEYWQFENNPQGGLSERASDGIDTSVVGAEELYPSDQESGFDELSPSRHFSFRSFPYLSSLGSKLDEISPNGGSRLKARSSGRLEGRDFKCPTGTFSCMSIDRPDRCCGTGQTCEIVKDTGLGDVGCCPNETSCSGTVGACQDGYTACPEALGGGCCIPGYECVSGGCKDQVLSLPSRLS